MFVFYEGVIVVEIGYVSSYEVGVIEFLGYKVLILFFYNGKLFVSEVVIYIEIFYVDGNY